MTPEEIWGVIVGTKESRLEKERMVEISGTEVSWVDGGTEEISCKLDVTVVDAWMGVRERFWPGVASRATSETAKPVGSVDTWIGVRERFWPAGASRATSETVTFEWRVDAWIGVRERFWPAGTSRATSETARPVGTGSPGEKIDSGTDPVGDRG